jgi:predicted membrane protein
MENEIKTSYRTGLNKGLGFGLFLMLIGVLFLGFNFGFFPEEMKRIVFSWPMLLLFFGVVNLFKRQYLSSIILIIIGTFFIIPRIVKAYPDLFPNFDGNFTHIYWPLLLIAAGIIIILGKVLLPQWGCSEWKHQHHKYVSSDYKWDGSKGNFSKNSVFADGKHIVLDPEFKGGELNAVFGGITLDLRKTNLPVGETGLEVNAVFGGVTILVPNDWYVETHVDAIFGGFEDKRMPMEPADTTRKLILHGACVFGGGELRN